MTFDIDEVFKEKKPGDIAALLPEFRGCQTYLDRLDFWDRYHLHLQVIHVATGEADAFARACTHSQAVMCRTWEEQKELAVLSIVPFTEEEINTFFNWGLPIRKQMQGRIQFFYDDKYNHFRKEKYKKDSFKYGLDRFYPTLFTNKHLESHTKNRKEFFFESHVQEISSIGENIETRIADFWERYAASHDKPTFLVMNLPIADSEYLFEIIDSLSFENERDLDSFYGINTEVYNECALRFVSGESTEIADIIPYPLPTDYRNWHILDTYIRAETDCLFRCWLSERKNEYEQNGTLSMPSADPTHTNENVALDRLITKHLKPFSGRWNKATILRDKEYSTMIADVKELISLEKNPEYFTRISADPMPAQFILKTFFNLHQELYGRKRRKYWFEFLKSRFIQLDGWSISVIDKKFSVCENYERDLAAITYDSPFSGIS